MKIQHVGRSAYRLTPGQDNPREVAFAEEWAKENTLTSAYGGRRYELIHDLLHGDGNGHQSVDLTQEEATVAATVVQWLGSNVGWSFLNQALKRAGYRIVTEPPPTEGGRS